jgi:hypothetical protein
MHLLMIHLELIELDMRKDGDEHEGRDGDRI